MAFSYVSTTANQTPNTLSTATSTTLAFAGSGPSLNSFLVCTVFVDHSTTTPARTVSTITDTRGNTWMRAAQGTLSSTQFLNAEIWCCWWNKAAGANTLTITLSGAPTGWCAFVSEYTTTSGRGARPDVSGSATSTTASQTTLAIPTASAAEAGELVIATAGLHATSVTTLGTSSTGYTTRKTSTGTIGPQAATYDKLSAAAAVETCTATFASHRYEAGAIATFIEVPAVSGYALQVWQEPSLQNYYRLDETTGTNVVDQLAHGTGTYFSPTLNQTGALTDSGDTNASVALSGASQYLTVPRQVSGDFSVEFWLNSSSGAGVNNTDMWQGQGLIQSRVTGGTADWGISLGSDGKIVFSTYNGTDFSCISGTGWNNGHWHHVVATRVQSSGAMALYIDGGLVSTHTGTTIALTSTATINIGRTPIELVYLIGSLDEIAFYTAALPQTTVQAHFQAGAFDNPTPVSRSSSYYSLIRATTGLLNYYSFDDLGSGIADNFGNGHGVHYVSNSSATPTLTTGAISGDSDSGFSFDGSTRDVRVPRQISGDFSVEFWFNSTSGSGTGNTLPYQGQTVVASRAPGGSADWGISLGADGIIVAGAFASGAWNQCVTGTGWNNGNWHHLVFTRVLSTGVMTLYIDSVSQGTATGAGIALDSSAFMDIGSNTIDHPYYNGALDEVAVYSTALSPTTVAQHYNAGIPATTGIPTYWFFPFL